MWILNFHILEFVLYYYQNKIDMMYCNNLHGKRLNYSTVLAACIKCTGELIIFDQIPSFAPTLFIIFFHPTDMTCLCHCFNGVHILNLQKNI